MQGWCFHEEVYCAQSKWVLTLAFYLNFRAINFPSHLRLKHPFDGLFKGESHLIRNKVSVNKKHAVVHEVFLKTIVEVRKKSVVGISVTNIEDSGISRKPVVRTYVVSKLLHRLYLISTIRILRAFWGSSWCSGDCPSSQKRIIKTEIWRQQKNLLLTFVWWW